jgi:predicted DNA-binding protein with PD1-like motif
MGRILVVRLGPGEDMLPAMERLIDDAGLGAGIILSGVASLHQATVRNIIRFPPSYPITTDDRRITTIPGPLEILATQGNFARTVDGGLVIHCHIDFSVGVPGAITYGGHLVEETIIATTCELYLAELVGADIRRELDPQTKAQEIKIDESPV